MCQPNTKPLKDPAPKPSSAHAIHYFIRLWINTVGGFEVGIRAGNEGSGFLFPGPLMCSWEGDISLVCLQPACRAHPLLLVGGLCFVSSFI